MALSVAPQALTPIQSLLDLPDERIQTFLDALKKAESKFNVNDLAFDVSNRSRMPRAMAEPVVQMLTSLYRARECQAISIDKFVDEQVGPALKAHLFPPSKDKAAAPTAQEIEARWNTFRKFLMAALALDNTVGTAAKAGPVITEHERIFQDARVLSDVRVIFHPDLAEKPTAAVIVHMLRLTTRDIFGTSQAQYFALDANDIRLMKQLMDRAIKKEDVLRQVMSSAGVSAIEPKGFF